MNYIPTHVRSRSQHLREKSLLDIADSLPCVCARDEFGVRVYNGFDSAQTVDTHDEWGIQKRKGCSLGKYIDTELKLLKASLLSSWKNTGDMVQIKETLNALDQLVSDNLSYFWNNRDTQANFRPLGNSLIYLQTILPAILDTSFVVSKCESAYSFSYTSPGNGYRSLLIVVLSCLTVLKECLSYCQRKRGQGLLFNAGFASKILSEYTAVLDTLGQLLSIAVGILRTSTCYSVFGVQDAALLPKLGALRKDHFYGSSFGFQFLPPLRRHLKVAITAMAALSSVYNKIEGNKQRKTVADAKTTDATDSSVNTVRGIPTSTGQSEPIHQTAIDHTPFSRSKTPPAVKSATGVGQITDRLASMDVLRPDTVFENIRFMINENERGLQLQRQLEQGDVGFLRYFWQITESEVATQLSNVFSPKPFVNTLLQVPSKAISVPFVGDDPDLNLRRDSSQGIRTETGQLGSEENMEAMGGHKPPKPMANRQHSSSGTKNVLIAPVKTSFEYVKVRVLCYHYHEGQQFQTLADEFHELNSQTCALPAGLTTKPAAEGLLFHIHGGGFVSGTSQSHQLYLRHWAHIFGVPIVSVDYSLAPEAPYPQALEECLQAYAWAIANAGRLGTKAKTICMAGDSAGGNLITAVTLKAITLGIRLPDALLPVYPALTLALDIPAPSRLLSVMDPLISFGALTTCFDAYLGDKTVPLAGSTNQIPQKENALYGQAADTRDADSIEGTATGETTSATDKFELRPNTPDMSPPQPLDPFLSPGLAPAALLKHLPPTYIVAAVFDPLLDCSVDFANRLRMLGNEVTLTVCPNVSHGFLAFATRGSGDEIADAAQECDKILQRVFAKDFATAKEYNKPNMDRILSPVGTEHVIIDSTTVRSASGADGDSEASAETSTKAGVSPRDFGIDTGTFIPGLSAGTDLLSALPSAAAVVDMSREFLGIVGFEMERQQKPVDAEFGTTRDLDLQQLKEISRRPTKHMRAASQDAQLHKHGATLQHYSNNINNPNNSNASNVSHNSNNSNTSNASHNSNNSNTSNNANISGPNKHMGRGVSVAGEPPNTHLRAPLISAQTDTQAPTTPPALLTLGHGGLRREHDLCDAATSVTAPTPTPGGSPSMGRYSHSTEADGTHHTLAHAENSAAARAEADERTSVQRQAHAQSPTLLKTGRDQTVPVSMHPLYETSDNGDSLLGREQYISSKRACTRSMDNSWLAAVPVNGPATMAFGAVDYSAHADGRWSRQSSGADGKETDVLSAIILALRNDDHGNALRIAQERLHQLASLEGVELGSRRPQTSTTEPSSSD